MAIYWNNTFIANGGDKSYPVLPSAAGSIVEGQMVVGEMSKGIMHAKPATDGTSDIQLGIAGKGMSRAGGEVVPYTASTVVDDGALVVNFGKKAEAVGASANPIAYTMDSAGTRTYFTFGTAATGVANITSLNPLTLTFHASDDGKTVYVEYAVKQSLDDVNFNQGYIPSAYYRPVSDILGTVNLIIEGTVSTDQYDNVAAWTGAGALRSVAGGYFSWNGDTGTVCDAYRAIVLQAPSFSRKFLTLSVNH